jgi:tRNA (mo5U34)-methyltransferase
MPGPGSKPHLVEVPGPAGGRSNLDIGELKKNVGPFKQRLQEIKRGIPSIEFYPYDTIGNLWLLDDLLRGARRDLQSLTEGRPVADVGAADGDLGFYLESLGLDVHLVDNARTNYNGLSGARAVKQALGSSVEIHDLDLDTQFKMPEKEYGLVLFLGILYHLKNPYHVLETLAKTSRHIVLSTRVTQYAPSVEPRAAEPSLMAEIVSRVMKRDRRMTRVAGLPVAYLVDERECNNDPTNYWVFSPEGLQRIMARCGWEIIDFMTTGNTINSDPASALGDQRAYCLARSRACASPWAR